MITRKLSCLNLPWTPVWHDLFGVARPLLVEIGFGNADYLIHLATTRPDYNLIGLEISNQSMEKAEAKIRKHGLHNVCAVHSRAEAALHHLFEPQSVSEFHINNPDPWFKTRHSGRRLIQRDTVDAMVNRLTPDGKLYLSTDVPAYAEMSHEVLSETPGLQNMLDTPWSGALPGRIVTKYESRGLRQGNPPKMFYYRRNGVPAPDVPVLRELAVPHLLLKTPMQPAEILEHFKRITFNAGNDIYVSVLEGYFGPHNRTLLFETTITEPAIDQHVALMLFPRDEPGEYTLRFGAMGTPRVTEGLHRAVRLMGEWIISLHPDAVILSSVVKSL